jgi:hypothetical protein
MDSDGRLDLILGNQEQASQLYRNTKGANGPLFVRDAAWAPPTSVKTTSVAIGDSNGDGALDLAMGNNGSFSQLYRGERPALTASDLTNTATDNASSLALSDVNNDGDLDLLLGNANAASQLYLNDGAGGFTLSTGLFSPAQAFTRAVAWGDVDNNGALDLVLGNNGAASQLYLNDGTGKLTLHADLFSPTAANTRAVAWGDVNNDGALDLVMGNESQASQLYLNNGTGKLTLDSSWNPESAPTSSLAWGDINNDGDLDLVMGNGSDKPSRLYRNCTYPDAGVSCPSGARLVLDTSWQPLRADTSSLALGDLNGDGGLDLVVGNTNNPTQIYLNDGAGHLAIDPSWQTPPSATTSVALSDMDGDQDLDLLVGNDGQASQIYRNNGGGSFTLLASVGALGGVFASTVAVAWGDLNGDGRLDLALANKKAAIPNQAAIPSQVVLSAGSAVATKAGPLANGPTISIRQPETPAGSLLATGKIASSTVIPIGYTLRDNEGDSVPAIAGFYSLDGGGTWRPAAASATTQTRNLATAPEGRTYSFGWDTFASCFFGQSDTVLFQLRALQLPLRSEELGASCGSLPASPSLAPGSSTYAGQVAGSSQRPFVGASTQLFRARGIQVRVLNGAAPAAGATVYRLTPGAEHATAMASSDGAPFTTDSNGYLAGRGTLAANDAIAALAPLTGLKNLLAGNPSLRFFSTSPIDIDTGAPKTLVKKSPAGQPSTQVLTAASSQPLALLDLKIGVEWDASKDEVFQRQLSSDLQRTSELLYDWTDGQVALGKLEVGYGPAALTQANIRILATNRLRPGATQGGIITQDLADPSIGGVTYKPGYVDIGAVWTRYGDSAGLGEDWPRALAHEIGHYALFLDDNYVGRNSKKQLISIPPPEATYGECRGAMSNPYRDDDSEFQPAGSEWNTTCAQTLSNYETKRADWQTIQSFYNSSDKKFSLRAPTRYNQYVGPSAQVLSFTSVILPKPHSGPTQPISAPIFSLVGANRTRYTAEAGARTLALRFTDGDSKAVDLGRPSGDQLNARGALPGDTICVYDQIDGGWRSGCTGVGLAPSPITIAAAANWQPRITITPLSTSSVRVTIAADGVVTKGQPAPTLSLKLFANLPAGDQQRASADVVLAPGASSYSYTFSGLSVPIYGGYLRVRVKDDTASAGRREVVTEYQVSGNLTTARASLQTKPCADSCAPLATSGDGQMLIYGDRLDAGQFYSFQAATTVPPAPAWGTFVGQIYRLYTNIPAAALGGKNLYITTAYLESELPAGAEGGLAIYYSADGTGWERLEQARFDPSRNEISSAVVGSGYYALVSRLEVTGSAAANWNNIAYPWVEPLGVLSATARLNIRPNTNFTTIHAYIQADQRDPWKVYDVDAPYWVNDLKQLEYGRGYWFIVPFGGGTAALYKPQQPSLAEGAPTPPATYYGTLPLGGANAAAAGLTVQATSGGSVCATEQTREQAVDPAQPSGAKQIVFLVQVPAAGQGAPAGCGIQGQPITVTVGGATVFRSTWDNTRPITLRRFSLPMLFGPAPQPPAASGGGGSSGGGSSGGGPWIGRPLP